MKSLLKSICKNKIILFLFLILFIIGIGTIIIYKTSNTNTNLKSKYKNNNKKIIKTTSISNYIETTTEKTEVETTQKTTKKTTKKKETIKNNSTQNEVKDNKKDNSPKQKATTNKVSVTSKSKDRINATKEYYCINPYKLSGNKCIYSDTQNALVRYYCTEGTLNGTKCDKVSTVLVQYYSTSAPGQCSSLYGSGHYNQCLCTKSGGYLKSNGNCYKDQNVSVNANIEYYCTGSYNVSGNQCTLYKETDAPFKLVCPTGYELKGTYCEK